MSIWVHIISNNVYDDFIWYVLGLSPDHGPAERVLSQNGRSESSVRGQTEQNEWRKVDGLRKWGAQRFKMNDPEMRQPQAWNAELSGPWISGQHLGISI